MQTIHENALTPSATARALFLRREGHPWFRADWAPALFVHFEVPTAALQPSVPFPLDCRDGKAYVSLVASRFSTSESGVWGCRVPGFAIRFSRRVS